MSTSAHSVRVGLTTRKPLIGFVVGRYFARGQDGLPDYNAINANIEAVIPWSRRLWEAGFLVFTPHLNTHHFQEKTRIDPDPLENEEYYRAFDRKLLAKGIDFIFATPNWRQSSGGRLEVQLACHLGIPVFESIEDVIAWAEGRTDYSRVIYDHITDAAKHFGEAKELKIALVDGLFWAPPVGPVDFPLVRDYARNAEVMAIELFNNKLAAFTPQLNASYERLGYAVPLDLYQLLCSEFLRRVADCHMLTPDWQDDPATRARIQVATKLKKPSFDDVKEALAWRDGQPHARVRLG